MPLPEESPDRRSASRVLVGKSGWGNPDRNACHVSLGDVRHVSLGRGVPTMPPFLTCRFCLSRMGELKIICFLKLRLLFCAHWATWRAGAKREESIYDEPSSLGIPRQRVVSMMARLNVWNTKGLSLYK